jgi:hypothetical protein
MKSFNHILNSRRFENHRQKSQKSSSNDADNIASKNAANFLLRYIKRNDDREQRERKYYEEKRRGMNE